MKIKIELNIYVYKDEVKTRPVKARSLNPEMILTAGKEQEKDKRNDEKMSVGIRELMEMEAPAIKKFHSYSTVKNYETAIKSYLTFQGKADASLSDITAEQVNGWQQWLRKKGVCLNSISCYMRSLRSFYNYAVEKGIVNQQHPFNKAFTGRTKTEKRSLEEEDIRRIKMVHLKKGSFLAMARDMFLFCFYALGMPFIDLFFLRKSQVSGDTLTYYRKKTGQRVCVHIEPCMREIIEKYDVSGSEYVFPLNTSHNEDAAQQEYLQLLGRYNRVLKILARKAEVTYKLTSYMARHTWASMAYQRNVALPVISKALGHTNTRTTLVYVKGINDNDLAVANQQLLREMGML